MTNQFLDWGKVAVIVLGFDLLLVGQVGGIQAAFFVDRPALLVKTRTSALS